MGHDLLLFWFPVGFCAVPNLGGGLSPFEGALKYELVGVPRVNRTEY